MSITRRKHLPDPPLSQVAQATIARKRHIIINKRTDKSNWHEQQKRQHNGGSSEIAYTPCAPLVALCMVCFGSVRFVSVCFVSCRRLTHATNNSQKSNGTINIFMMEDPKWAYDDYKSHTQLEVCVWDGMRWFEETQPPTRSPWHFNDPTLDIAKCGPSVLSLQSCALSLRKVRNGNGRKLRA